MIDWAGFAAAVLLIELTPGPNMAWLAGLTLTDGRRAGLAATAGIALGLLANAALAAFGLAELIASHPGLALWLRRAGAAVMLLLAFETWRTAARGPSTAAGRRGFGAGFALNLLNPKAFVFFIAVVPAFLRGGPLSLAQALGLGLLSVTIATAIHLLIVLGAAQADAFFNNARRITTVRRVMAVVMVGVAAWFVAG